MKKDKLGFYKNKHASFLLQYHLVLVIKYKKPALKGEVDKFIKEYFKYYFNKNEYNTLEMESNFDHMHILFEAPATISLVSFINGLKTVSSRMARKRFKENLDKYFWKPYFWSRSYFIATVSERNTNIVKNYIQKQRG